MPCTCTCTHTRTHGRMHTRLFLFLAGFHAHTHAHKAILYLHYARTHAHTRMHARAYTIHCKSEEKAKIGKLFSLLGSNCEIFCGFPKRTSFRINNLSLASRLHYVRLLGNMSRAKQTAA